MLHADNSVLVLVDYQVKLLRAIPNRDALLDQAARLIRGAKVLALPILVTEQYPDGLGPTSPELTELLEASPVTKMTFSCCGEAAFSQALDNLQRQQILLAGIESHVCVYQTARDLLDQAFDVHVVADAISSRTPANRQIGLDAMVAAGASVTSVEMALFELLHRAGTDEFKQMLSVVK